MTLESFALASRERGFTTESASFVRYVDMASMVSNALQRHGNAQIERMLPGAGLWSDGSQLRPTVLADRAALRSGYGDADLLPAVQIPEILEVFSAFFGGWPLDLANELRVLLVTQGEQHAAPGTPINSSTHGRTGPHVRWGSNMEGFLTAGHVASTVHSVVADMGGATVGTVLWANDPALAPSTTGDLDVALVVFDPAHRASTGLSRVIPAVGDHVTVASTANTAPLFGFFDHVRLGAAQACYSQCYATEWRITQQGDSGGLVEALGGVVGMVIGGFTRRDMTLIQAVDYQINEINKRSGYLVSL
jgi:hypothetical protein